MEYVACLKWGGIHGDMVLQRANGNLLYIVKGAPLGYHRECAVVDAKGKEVFRVYRPPRLFGNTYHIGIGGRTVGKVCSNWCGSRGHIDIAELPAVCCKYGWGA